MAKVHESGKSKHSISESDMRIFFEIEKVFGIRTADYESFNDYMAALFAKSSTEKLKGALRLPGDTFNKMIKYELNKREVFS